MRWNSGSPMEGTRAGPWFHLGRLCWGLGEVVMVMVACASHAVPFVVVSAQSYSSNGAIPSRVT